MNNTQREMEHTKDKGVELDPDFIDNVYQTYDAAEIFNTKKSKFSNTTLSKCIFHFPVRNAQRTFFSSLTPEDIPSLYILSFLCKSGCNHNVDLNTECWW